MKKPKAGEKLKLGKGLYVIIAKVHEWEEYYDLEVIDEVTDKSGHIRTDKHYESI